MTTRKVGVGAGVSARDRGLMRIRRVVRQRLVAHVRILFSLASVVVVVGVWSLVAQLALFPSYVLPSPWQVVDAAVVQRQALMAGTIVTVGEVMVGFACAVVLGVAIGIGLAFSRVVGPILYPWLVSTQAVPKIAVAPLFVLWFGFGELPKVLMVIAMAIFPVVLDTVVGLKAVDQDLIRMAKATRASRVRVFIKIRVPVALPSIFSGLKMAATFSVVGAVVGEFIAGTSGLGYIVESAQGNEETGLAFAALALLGVMSLVFFYGIEFAERKLLRGAQ